MKPILIADAQNLAYRNYFSLERLDKVSLIYGLPMMVGSFVKRYNPSRLYLVWDGKKSKERLKLLPTYKERKQKFGFDPEDFYSQRNTTMEMFNALGVKQIYHKESEADDQVYLLYERFRDKKKIIISNDKDFHQLIDENTHILNAKEILLNSRNLRDNFGYDPNTCVDYLILTGDDSDRIPGYPGMGEVRTKEFFKSYSSIKEFLNCNNSYKFIDKVKLEAIYKRNRQLIDLAFYNKKFMKDAKPKFWEGNANPKFDKKALFEICDRFNIKMFKKKSFLGIWSR